MSTAEFYTIEERKVNGVFYTPQFLAEYLAKKIVDYSNKRKITNVMDPACGDSILLKAFLNELSPENKSTIKVFGIDKDINAIINSAATFDSTLLDNEATNFIHTDGLFPIVGENFIDSWNELKKIKNIKKGFDVITSNPPWGADLSCYNPLKLSSNFLLAKGQYDIFNLFFEVILHNLNDDGIYGLILPDSIFSQEQVQFRRLLSTNTSIDLIARLGEKIFPEINRACVVIVGRKTKPKNDHQVDCFRLSPSYKKRVISKELTLEEVQNELSHKIPQKRFVENTNYTFDIDLRTDEQSTFDKLLSKSTTVKQFVTNTRGAEISKKGIVCQCPNCERWMPYPKNVNPNCTNCKLSFDLEITKTEKIILSHNGTGNVKLKVGEDLYRFNSISKSWINTLKDGINYKNLDIYCGDKILVRKTGVGITACIDYDNSITNQVVYILKLNPESEQTISLEFILSVLNSRVMTYYLIKKYGENEWKTHPYLTQTMLVELPFPKIDFNSPNSMELINRVTEIVKTEVKNSDKTNISKNADLYLERIVAHFFDLNSRDYKTIFATLESAEQLIPIKRLLNCTVNEIFQLDGL